MDIKFHLNNCVSGSREIQVANARLRVVYFPFTKVIQITYSICLFRSEIHNQFNEYFYITGKGEYREDFGKISG